MTDYRIDDLARAAGTTVRNVRVYQDRGLLPPPRREGRTGIYSDAHLARLRLIAQLLERGYTFAHIGGFLDAWERGRDLTDVLGFEEALTSRWTDETPGHVTVAELVELFGAGELTPDNLARAADQGLLIADADGFLVPSPRLLHAGSELTRVGIPLSVVLDLSAALALDMAASARRLVSVVATHILPGAPGFMSTAGRELHDLAAVIARLRPLAQLAVDAHLARAMENEVRASLGEHVAAAGPDPTAPAVAVAGPGVSRTKIHTPRPKKSRL